MATGTGRSHLTTFDLLRGLDAAGITRTLGGLPALRLAPGDLFDLGDQDVACCLVRSGRLALDFNAPDRTHHRTVTLVEEGDVLIPPADDRPSTHPRLRFRALQPSVVLLVDRPRYEEWLADPRIAANLVRVLAAQIADRELAVAIALEPRVERRLLLKLRQLGERYGRVTPHGIRLDLRLTHQELADMVGAVRESVTIALGKLAANDEITVENRTIWIHPADPPGGTTD